MKEVKEDHVVFGDGAPMTGILSFGPNCGRESGGIARKTTVNSRPKALSSKENEVPSLPKQGNADNNGLDSHRVPFGKPASFTLVVITMSKHVIGGSHTHPHKLADISNSSNTPGLPTASSNYSMQTPKDKSQQATRPVDMGPPRTPINRKPAPNFSTPIRSGSSRDRAEASKYHGISLQTTPRHRIEASNSHGIALQTTPSNSSNRYKNRSNASLALDLASIDLHHAGRENSMSGMPTASNNMGRQIPGMRAAIERRHQKVDERGMMKSQNHS